MKLFNKSLVDISVHKYIRSDYKYWAKIKEINFSNYNLLKDIFYIIKGSVQTENYVLDKTSIPYVRISDIELKYGINLSEALYLDEDIALPSEKLLKKDDLIVAIIGTVGKVSLAGVAENGTHSNNTVVLRAKKADVNMKFYEKLFQSDYYMKYLLGVVSQKAQPNLQLYDLQNIKLPIVEDSKILSAVSKITPIENKITDLKKEIKDVQSIVDEILISKFNIDYKKVEELESFYHMNKDLNFLVSKNDGVRFSFRFYKGRLIQDLFINSTPCFTKLGNYILSTQNGWSPQCYDEELRYQVLGIDAIRADTKLAFCNFKYTNEEKNNINNYFVKEGDFFVSRGNTTDLVALASIADANVIDRDAIFPDLMIRVEFNKEINKQYMAYIFNSFIGRLYFKYVTKGKNQTMVKVSEKELKEFYVPIPVLAEQQRIVDKIQTEIDKQNEIQNRIAKLRRDIDQIIENAIGMEKIKQKETV